MQIQSHHFSSYSPCWTLYDFLCLHLQAYFLSFPSPFGGHHFCKTKLIPFPVSSLLLTSVLAVCFEGHNPCLLHCSLCSLPEYSYSHYRSQKCSFIQDNILDFWYPYISIYHHKRSFLYLTAPIIPLKNVSSCQFSSSTQYLHIIGVQYVFLFSRLVSTLFKMVPSAALKCCLVFPSARKL